MRLRKLLAPSTLIAISALLAGWKWEIFPH
jgi:hypothetical protein